MRSTPTLKPLKALRQGLGALARQPGLAFGFSALACGLHLLGWALFAAGHSSDSAVLALVFHGLGLALYAGSLIWLIEGLTRIGLAVGADQHLRWKQLCRWHGQRSVDLALGLLNTGLALAATALAGFMAWSLVVFLVPALSVLPAVMALGALATMALSQLFNACLVLDQRLSPSKAFSVGMLLLSHHWPELMALAPLLITILAAPFLVGVVAEAIGAGLGVVLTVLAMVIALPVLASTVTAAYRQLRAPVISPAAR